MPLSCPLLVPITSFIGCFGCARIVVGPILCRASGGRSWRMCVQVGFGRNDATVAHHQLPGT
ncbi:hypothetical protein LX32DRAFT_635106 [Colletotrichum zoysiae]|uniref:Uncharacterized protein n=1 Tax=Colletotrichum zoysiae TaxID=1216348 RepID=A0AAD9HSF9_9PEZI|nr:hypothetical protein LX32DRAFT_635106 [Colletotrichum zoysiae]